MATRVISVDQSTQSTKGFLFDEKGQVIGRASRPHRQIYPRPGFVEHDPEEIYANTVEVIRELVKNSGDDGSEYSIAITNQRETVVVWDKNSGKPVCNAVVWQCMRGEAICNELKAAGCGELFRSRSGLLIDPYFSGSGVKWILDNVDGARRAAERGELLMGTVETWLIWKLTGGKSHVTDYTNASRTMLFNVHTLDWDDELRRVLTVPESMLAEPLPCDAFFGETTVEGLFNKPVPIEGVIGDSHGALTGQMCFTEGSGKATYGTGSSVMVNIGETFSAAPPGLVTSIGYSALGRTFYAFEGNVHSTGMSITWLEKKLGLIGSASEIEALATSVTDNGGVYFVPAFSGLGAPWWLPTAKATFTGMTLGTGKAHICRAVLESIGYQIADLIGAMTSSAGIKLRELKADGGPTKNGFLMEFQSDLLGVPVVRSEIEDASAFGAFLMNGFASGRLESFGQASALAHFEPEIVPAGSPSVQKAYEGWKEVIRDMINKK